jgi:hypothetical protein
MPSSGEMGRKKYSLDTVILVGKLMELLLVYSGARLKDCKKFINPKT